MNIRIRVLNFFMEQAAGVLISVKNNEPLPLRAICIIMSLSGLIIRCFITRDIVHSSIFSGVLTLMIHFAIVFLLTKYVLNDRERMRKVVKFLKAHHKEKD